MDKKTIGIYVDDEVLHRIRYVASWTGKSRNQLIAEMLEFSVDCYEQDILKIAPSVDKQLDEVLLKGGIKNEGCTEEDKDDALKYFDKLVSEEPVCYKTTEH